MTDWSDKAVGRINQKLQERNLKDEVFLERQKIKSAHGIRLWNQARSDIKKEVSALNKSALKVLGKDVLVIQKDESFEMEVCEIESGIPLTLTFHQQIGMLSWAVGSQDQDQLEVVVTEDGRVRFQCGGVTMTPNLIATRMLNELLHL